MPSSQLFVVLVGIMPALVFVSTVWLTDGAPFDPFDGRTVVHPAASTGHADPAMPAPVAATVRPGAVERAATARDDRDSDWLRLRRLANDGDTGAALLLVILDGSQQRGSGPRP